MLLDSGAHIDVSCPMGMTALSFAAHEGKKEVCELLLKYGSKDLRDFKGRSALIIAADKGNQECVNVLLAKFPQLIEQKGLDGYTALQLASHSGNIAVVKVLVEHNANISASNGRGWNPLLLATKSGHYDIVHFLLSKGSNKNHATTSGWTALITASAIGHDNICELLLDSDVEKNVRNNDGLTGI
jgi:ankyrin repeat protein